MPPYLSKVARLKHPFEVLAGTFLLGIGKELARHTCLNHFTHIHKNHVVGQTFGLAQRGSATLTVTSQPSSLGTPSYYVIVTALW